MGAKSNTVHLRKNRASIHGSGARSPFAFSNRSVAVSLDGEASSRSPWPCGWWRALRVSSALTTMPDLRRWGVGRFRYDPDGFGDVDGRERPIGLAAHLETAHLAFDAAFVSSMPAGRDSLLQDFVEDRVMQRRLGQRGKKRRTSAICGGRLGSRARTTVDPDPRRRAAPLHA